MRPIVAMAAFLAIGATLTVAPIGTAGGSEAMGRSAASTSGQAVQNPDYPGEILRSFRNSCADRTVYIRAGKLTEENRGFGYYKVAVKHNIGSLNGVEWAMKSTRCVLQGNGNWRMAAYVRKLFCDDTGCELIDEIELLGIHNPRRYDKYFGANINGVLGLSTLYCVGYQGPCPGWVTSALNDIAGRTSPGRTSPRGSVRYVGSYSRLGGG